MAFKSRLKCLFLKPIFCILFATFLHFARNTTVLERVIKQEKTNARMDCFKRLYEKGMDVFEVLELLGISQNDIEMINEAAYVWQDMHL